MDEDRVAALEASLRSHERADIASLEGLLRIPSISAPGHPQAPLEECAAAVASLLTDAGLHSTELIRVGQAPPYVYGEWLGAPGRPTLLLYAHYDVQPVGDRGAWSADPFDPVAREGRLYARGAADDKAGVLVHVAALRAWLEVAGALPVNIRVLVEGEEENGSAHCREFLAQEAGRLRCDGIVLADAANWDVGVPALTYSLRGATTLTIEVRTMAAPAHSGIWGGLLPDPLMALAKVLATLVDERGVVAVPGFMDDVIVPTNPVAGERSALDEARVRQTLGIVESAMLWGDEGQALTERVWHRPCVTIRGLDAPPILGSPNAIQPVARAQINVRLAPGQDPERATQRLEDHLRGHVPWGLGVSITRGAAYPGWCGDPSTRWYRSASDALTRAFGAPTQFVGMGGSVPLVGWFLEALGDVPVLLTGVEDPLSSAHGPDESVHLGDAFRACLAEALLLGETGAKGI